MDREKCLELSGWSFQKVLEMALTPHAAAGAGGTGGEVGVKCEVKPGLLQGCAAVQSLLVPAAPVHSWGRKPPPEQIPSKQTPEGSVPGTQVTPQVCSPGTRALLWLQASLARWGRQCPFLQPEDEEEQLGHSFTLGEQAAPDHRHFDL